MGIIVTLHYIKFLNMSYHYNTFGNAPSNYNNYLTSEWGKFKLAKQHDSSIHEEVLLFLSKG